LTDENKSIIIEYYKNKNTLTSLLNDLKNLKNRVEMEKTNINLPDINISNFMKIKTIDLENKNKNPNRNITFSNFSCLVIFAISVFIGIYLSRLSKTS